MYVLAKRMLYSFSIVLACGILNVSYADDNNSTPKFDCTLTNQVTADNQAGDAQSTFTKDTPKIYLFCSSDDVQKGQTVKSVWIAADTNNVAPPNYKIDEKSIQVPAIADDQTYDTNFSLSKPNNGWPVGSYHVDIYVDDQLAQSVKFNVK
jgi:hypothetical protein